MAVYDIKQNSKFDKSDVSAAINDVISNMRCGDSAILEYGEYEIRNTVNIGSTENYLEHCTISLRGVYKFIGKETAIRIRANYLNFNLDRLYTGMKSDHYKSNPEDILPGGIEILESNYSALSVDEVEGFEYGLKLCPNIDDTGICYTKFNFRYISYCYIPLYFAVDDNAVGWINENQFYGGRLKGYYGLKAKKGEKQIDECNNNTFYNIAFESIETNGIDLEFCTFNTILSPRFESVMKYAINESENCKSNKYIISVALPLDSININSKYTHIEAPLHTYWEHMISKYMTDSEGNKSYEFFRNITINLKDGVTELPMNCKNIMICEDDSSIKIILDKYSEFENNKISIYNNAQGCELTILNKDKETVVDSLSLASGKYELLYTQKSWSFIGNAFENDVIRLNKAAL